MKTELPEQSKGHENAGNVGHQPAWVPYHLKDRVIRGLIHLVPVKGLTLMTQGSVHIDKCSPVPDPSVFRIISLSKLKGISVPW